MDRGDLSFLEPMFPGRDLSELNIFIINQTTGNNILESGFPNIRVINSFERGLSKSRNLALKNSVGEIGLIADDDMAYEADFDKTILAAFEKHKEAAMISFQFLGENALPTKKYIDRERRITSLKDEPALSSVELAIRPEMLRENQVWFNEYFGLGANFPSGEESLFLKEAIDKKLPVYHVPEVIGQHPRQSTGTKPAGKAYIRGVSALKYLKYGKWAKFSLLRFVCLSVRKKKIPLRKSIWAYRIGSRAIVECKSIFKNKTNPFK